jgi:hypothetical protein
VKIGEVERLINGKYYFRVIKIKERIISPPWWGALHCCAGRD